MSPNGIRQNATPNKWSGAECFGVEPTFHFSHGLSFAYEMRSGVLPVLGARDPHQFTEVENSIHCPDRIVTSTLSLIDSMTFSFQTGICWRKGGAFVLSFRNNLHDRPCAHGADDHHFPSQPTILSKHSEGAGHVT